MFWLSLVSRFCFFCFFFFHFLISSMIHWLFCNILFRFCVFVFIHFFSNWFLISYIQKICLIWFQFSYIYQVLTCDPRCDLSWRTFHVYLRIKYILFLSYGISSKYQLILFGAIFKGCISLLIFYPDDQSNGLRGMLNLSVFLCYCWFLLLWPLTFNLYIDVPLWWLHK